MKELDTWDAMQMAFEYYKKDSITVYELNKWTEKYQEDHPDTYAYIDRHDIHYEHECKRIWWEIRDNGSDILHRQEEFVCPVCDVVHYKYPKTEKFEKIQKIHVE